MYKIFIFLQLTSLSFMSFSPIVEHNKLSNLSAYFLDKDPNHTLTVFDIDNVLLQPKGYIGGSPWFEYMLKQNNMGYEDILNICIKYQDQIELIPVETETPKWVQFAQNNSKITVAMTGRSIKQFKVTNKYLNKFGIDFSKASIGTLTSKNKNFHYLDGMIFCESSDKGQVIIEFLEKIELKPKKIIFIDDMMKNLKSVESALLQYDKSIQFIGMRYSHLDYKFDNFDEKKAEKELQELKLFSKFCKL